MKKFTLILLVVVLAFSFLLSARGDDNPCANGSACGITAPAGDLQQAVTDFLNDTCPQRTDGTCKTMGE